MIRPWVAIQRSPSAGSGRRRRFLLDLAAALNRNGLRPHIYSSRESLTSRLSDPDRRAALVGVVAAGGDGTLADVANRFPGIPVCPFPLGTENLLARYLGIPLDGESVARTIAAGHRRRVDIGLAGIAIAGVSSVTDGDLNIKSTSEISTAEMFASPWARSNGSSFNCALATFTSNWGVVSSVFPAAIAAS